MLDVIEGEDVVERCCWRFRFFFLEKDSAVRGEEEGRFGVDDERWNDRSLELDIATV